MSRATLEESAEKTSQLLRCGAVAGLLFALMFTVVGAELGWAGYSALSSLAMFGGIVMMGRAFDGGSRLVDRGGIFQRISILCGLGWLTALSLRALHRLVCHRGGELVSARDARPR
jgi:hypothetical protein